MTARARPWLAPASFTAALVGLVIAAAYEPNDRVFTLVLVVALGGSVAFLQAFFPGSRFFVLALANGLAIYVCVFTVFLRSNFATVAPGAIWIGFVLPVAAFLAGAWWRRRRIGAIVAQTHVGDRQAIARGAAWLLPVFGIGVATFAAPNVPAAEADAVFLLAMVAIAGIVFAVSADVATFLVEAGLLFDEFFERIRTLIAPAFAFMTFYSIIVIVFASIYRLMDRFDAATNFAVGGAVRALSLPESLYFSIVTMATVGYGDIVPASDAARMVAAVQVVLGVLLLLFGFSELMAYARERRGRPEA